MQITQQQPHGTARPSLGVHASQSDSDTTAHNNTSAIASSSIDPIHHNTINLKSIEIQDDSTMPAPNPAGLAPDLTSLTPLQGSPQAGYSTKEGWLEKGGLRFAFNKSGYHLFMQIRPDSESRPDWTQDNDQSHQSTYSIHAWSSDQPVWISDCNRAPVHKGGGWTYVSPPLAKDVQFVAETWKNYFPRGLGCKFSFMKAYGSFMKLPILTKYGKQKILVALLNTLLARQVNHNNQFIVPGLMNRKGQPQRIFCSNLILKLLQVSWLYGKVSSDASLSQRIDDSIARLVHFVNQQGQNTTNHDRALKINAEIWKAAETLSKCEDVFKNIPWALRCNAGSQEPWSVARDLRVGLAQEPGAARKIELGAGSLARRATLMSIFAININTIAMLAI